MQFLRKMGLVLATSLLPIFLFFFGLTFSLFQIFGSADHIKAALDKSDVYDTFISDVLANVKVEGGKNEGIPVDRPEVQSIIHQAASPAFLQEQTEELLDDLYAWVSGESEQLHLEIDLTEAKNNLTEGLTQYANDRLATLPVCTSAVPADSFDPLNAACVPLGLDRGAAVEKVRQEIASGEFLQEPVITQESIKNDEGKPLQEQLKAVPGVYNMIKSNLWVSGGLAVLLTAAVILLNQSWRVGVKRAGIIFISVGAVSAALAWTASFLAQKLADNFAKPNEDQIQTSLAKIFNILANDLRTWWLTFGLIVLGLGIAAIVTLKFVKPKGEGATAPASEMPIKKDGPTETPTPKNPINKKIKPQV